MSDSSTDDTAYKFVVSRLAQATFVPGRRDIHVYRDLGAKDATDGRMRAQVIQAKSSMDEPIGWHYHVCDVQINYMLKGWADLEFEDGTSLRMEAGDLVMIPGGFRHNELCGSDDLESLEFSIPADMGTVACDPPDAPPSSPLSAPE